MTCWTRRKIADFDPVRDDKTITQFCKEEGISRQTFHNLKDRVAKRGRAGILPDSTAPKNPARKYTDADRQAVFDARVELKQRGWTTSRSRFTTPCSTPSARITRRHDQRVQRG